MTGTSGAVGGAVAGSTGHSVEAAGGGALARTGTGTSGDDGGAGSTRHTVEAGGGGALAGIGPGDDGGGLTSSVSVGGLVDLAWLEAAQVNIIGPPGN